LGSQKLHLLVTDLAGLFHGRMPFGDVSDHALLRVVLLEGQTQLLFDRLHRVHAAP
jgi:hypothetical protein